MNMYVSLILRFRRPFAEFPNNGNVFLLFISRSRVPTQRSSPVFYILIRWLYILISNEVKIYTWWWVSLSLSSQVFFPSLHRILKVVFLFSPCVLSKSCEEDDNNAAVWHKQLFLFMILLMHFLALFCTFYSKVQEQERKMIIMSKAWRMSVICLVFFRSVITV